MFTSEKPLNIAKPFLKKVLFLMKMKNIDTNDTMLILGTHQTTTESIIYSLLSPELPEEWKRPLGYSEYADFNIIKQGKSPVLKITFRGISKEISQETIQNRVQERS